MNVSDVTLTKRKIKSLKTKDSVWVAVWKSPEGNRMIGIVVFKYYLEISHG